MIAGGQKFPVPLRHLPVDNRADCMQDIPAGQIKCRRDFRLSGRFRIALPLHQFLAGNAQFDARIGMNGIVDAAVVRNIAAGHAGVCRIDNGVALKCRNIALPEIQPRLDRRQVNNIGNPFCGGFTLQICVLHLKEISADTYAWSEKAREEKKKCDREIISLEEFQQWLRDSKI